MPSTHPRLSLDHGLEYAVHFAAVQYDAVAQSSAGSFKGPVLCYTIELDPYRTNFRPINILVGHDYLIKVTK